MSSSIKPPGTNPVAPPVSAEGAGPTAAPRNPEAFRAALDGAGAAPAVHSTQGAGSVEKVVAELRAGRVDVAGAVEALVAEALGGKTVSALPPARRAELEGVLRQALAEDPALVELQRDLERQKDSERR